MRSARLFARPSIRLTLIALIAPLVTAPTVAAEPAGPATTQSVLQCAASVPIYTVRQNGELWLYPHLEPENGLNSWGTARHIGSGWHLGRAFGGANGTIYLAKPDGTLYRYRWNGSGWDTLPGGQPHELIDTDPGWARYTTSEYKGRITADAKGDIYTIEPDGNLHWRNYNVTTRAWNHRIIAVNWTDTLITAAGPGVLHVSSIGYSHRLERFRYHAESQRVVQERTSLLPPPSGGHIVVYKFAHLLSPGGDISYAVTTDDLRWFRYDEDTNTLNRHGPIGNGWSNQHATFAAPDACQRVGLSVPARPQVAPQPRAPVTLMRSSNGHVHYSYVDPEGRAAYADADLSGGSVGVAVVPGFTGVTGITSTGENQDGRVQIVGQGLDSEIRNNVKTEVGGPWGGTTTLGGFMVSPAALLRLPDNTLVTYAVDESGSIWSRKQIAANGPSAAWRPQPGHASHPLGAGPLTVVPTTDGGRIIGQSRDGNVLAGKLSSDGSTSGWINIGGGAPGFLPGVSAIVMPDNTLQVLATWHNGVVYTRRETSAGWSGSTWTAIPGVTASGRPSAIMAPEGTLQIVVRATDGYVYYTGQPAPGSPAFNPWREVTNFTEQSATDPTALGVPESNTWVIAYRTDLEVPRLLRYAPSATGSDAESTSAPEFVHIPMRPPAS